MYKVQHCLQCKTVNRNLCGIELFYHINFQEALHTYSQNMIIQYFFHSVLTLSNQLVSIATYC